MSLTSVQTHHVAKVAAVCSTPCWVGVGVALEGVDDQRPLIIVCGDGERSASLAAELRERGREVASIEGGMKAWEGEKLPMQPSSDPDDDVRV
jgi:rhodanese-related sulfurtransferase